MSTVAIALVLLSASIHIGWNSLTKSSRQPKVFSLIKGSLIVLATLALLPLFPLSWIPVIVWKYIILSGLIHGIYILSLSSAYETGDISFVYPIARSAPAFVPVAAYFFLGEILSVRGIIGIGFVVMCIFMMQFRGEVQTARKLWLSMKQRDFFWAILTLLSVVSYTIVDKAGMINFKQVTEIKTGYHGLIFFMLENMLCYTIFWIYLACRREIKFVSVWKHEWIRILTAAAGTLISYSLILHVMQTEEVSYIVTLRQSSVLMAVLVGALFFKEKYGRARFALALAMIFGFYLVATA
ncbi:MAG: EamA family transporter [Deltaproteobacteria bacterium]|nr:MAG: EamA family transporter [Deltaproteobacteria bacterium]